MKGQELISGKCRPRFFALHDLIPGIVSLEKFLKTPQTHSSHLKNDDWNPLEMGILFLLVLSEIFVLDGNHQHFQVSFKGPIHFTYEALVMQNVHYPCAVV